MNDSLERRLAQIALEELKAGKRIVVSGPVYNAIIDLDDDFTNSIASAHNRKAVGTQDTFVAWATDESRPADLTFDTAMRAWASP